MERRIFEKIPWIIPVADGLLIKVSPRGVAIWREEEISVLDEELELSLRTALDALLRYRASSEDDAAASP